MYRVNYPRVNNHFATNPMQAQGSFDLHALSTLPALILSQDQTLKLNRFETARSPAADVLLATGKPDVEARPFFGFYLCCYFLSVPKLRAA